MSPGSIPVLITSNFKGSGKSQETHTEPFYYGTASSDSKQKDIKTITQHASVTENVNYYYENGPHASNPVTDKPNTTITVTYTRTGTYDATKDPNGNHIEWTPDKDQPQFSEIIYLIQSEALKILIQQHMH
ncbi:MAG: mucin-binding protein [Lactobacillus helveticus]